MTSPSQPRNALVVATQTKPRPTIAPRDRANLASNKLVDISCGREAAGIWITLSFTFRDAQGGLSRPRVIFCSDANGRRDLLAGQGYSVGSYRRSLCVGTELKKPQQNFVSFCSQFVD